MQEKFDYYDLLGHVIPGLVLIGAIYLLFYWFGTEVKIPAFSGAVGVLVVLGIAIFSGNLLQALSSLLEPFYFWTWGGKPSDKLLAGKSPRLSEMYISLLKETIKDHLQLVKGEINQIDYELEDRDVFLHCLTLCNQKSLGRVNRFNSLYAYHRALTTLSLLLLIVTIVALIKISVPVGAIWVISGEIVITLILWNRTRQRGYYFAEEVLRVGAYEIVSPTAKKEEKQQI